MTKDTHQPQPAPANADDEQLIEWLRADFPGHRIWRGHDRDGRPGGWVATLHDPAAGVEPTVIRTDAAALRKALTEEAQKARQPGRSTGSWT
ncbi:hypothetical protein GCM10010182_80220 [Actinomadura cremea]|nr:hypothetical protein GCM10010182_80220 [Actinomadura cremea]